MEKNLIQKNNWIRTFLFLFFIVGMLLLGNINITNANLINAINNAQQQSNNTNSTARSTDNTGALINAINTNQPNNGNCTTCGTANTNNNTNTSNSASTVSASANNYSEPSCPFSAQANRTIVNLDTWLVWGTNPDWRQSVTRSVNLPAGEYNVRLFAWDAYATRPSSVQGNESYYVELKNGNSVIFKTSSTPDLQDGIVTASYNGVINSNITLSQAVNTVTANHSNYLNFMSSPNSVYAGCVAFDRIITEVQDAELSASCTVNPSSVNVGGTLSWGTTASGGTGSYTYSWTGTDGLTSNSAFISKSYSNAGTKTGVVTVTSGTQSVTRTCNAVVNQNQVNNDLSISCSASPSSVEVDEEVDWRANASGGTGSYTYSWSGTDGLSGSNRNIDWTYDDEGTKRGTVTVYSGSQSASASCTVRVEEEEEDDDDLEVSCYANPTNPQVGSQMNWYARVDGGDGDYDYDWDGTDGLNSSSRSPFMTYYTAGTKNATVVVRDGDGQRKSRICSVYVGQNTVLAFSQTNQPPLAQAVYLNQVPYTGVADNYKTAIFVGILALISAWIAYIVIAYNQSKKINPVEEV
jgi:hypothetical protein